MWARVILEGSIKEPEGHNRNHKGEEICLSLYQQDIKINIYEFNKGNKKYKCCGNDSNNITKYKEYMKSSYL